jgi:pyocin large subunit-like protein
MGVRTVKAVREHSHAAGSTFTVLAYLADRVFEENIERDQGALAWPSQATIARDIRWSQRTVSRALSDLVDEGEIVDTELREGRAHQETVVWAVLPEVFGYGEGKE